MATIRPYCTAEDAIKYLPRSTGKKIGSDSLLTANELDSFCIDISADMDFAFSSNGYITPIEVGEPDSLLSTKLKNVAVIGVCGRIQRALRTETDQLEQNYYERLYFMQISSIIKNRLPGVERTITIRSPRTEQTNSKEWFTKDGINFDSY